MVVNHCLEGGTGEREGILEEVVQVIRVEALREILNDFIFFLFIGVSKGENGTCTTPDSDRFMRSHMRLHVTTPNWSFVFDPAGRLCYYWSIIVSLAFLYNFWVIIYRFAFQEINRKYHKCD